MMRLAQQRKNYAVVSMESPQYQKYNAGYQMPRPNYHNSQNRNNAESTSQIQQETKPNQRNTVDHGPA